VVLTEERSQTIGQRRTVGSEPASSLSISRLLFPLLYYSLFALRCLCIRSTEDKLLKPMNSSVSVSTDYSVPYTYTFNLIKNIPWNLASWSFVPHVFNIVIIIAIIIFVVLLLRFRVNKCLIRYVWTTNESRNNALCVRAIYLTVTFDWNC
jgi:hypothetical protein